METTKKVGMHITHEVNNFTEWKAGFDAHESARSEMGVKITGVYSAADNQNLVTITSEVANLETAQGMMADPNMKEMMKKSGVVSEPVINIVTIHN